MKYNLCKQEKKFSFASITLRLQLKKKIDKLHYSGKGGFSLLCQFSRFNGKKQICGWYHNGNHKSRESRNPPIENIRENIRNIHRVIY